MNFSNDLFPSHQYHRPIHSSLHSDVDGLQSLRPFSRLDDVVKVSLLNDAVIPSTTSTMASSSSTFSPSSLLSNARLLLSRDADNYPGAMENTTANVISSVLANSTLLANKTTGNKFIDEAGREFSSVLVHAIICNRLIDLDGYNSTVAAICGMMLFIGLIYIAAGYRCFKLTMFLVGFLLGTTLVYLICSEENALGMWGNVGVAVGSGLLLGLITMLVDYVGLFTLGLILGALMAVVTLVGMYMGNVIPSSMWTAIGIIFGEALLFALLTLWQSKFFTILASSAVGAALLTAVMDYFIEKWRLSLWVADRIRLVRPSPNATLVMSAFFNEPNAHNNLPHSARGRASSTVDDDLWLPTGDHPNSSGGQRAGELFGIGDGGEAFVHPSLCWYSWLILIAWPTFLLIGILAQWLLTAKDYYYYTDHSRHEKLDLHRRRRAAQQAARRRRATTTTTQTATDTSRSSSRRRARRASTSSVCYVSVEEDNGWHYRHATVPTTGVTAVGTASSSSVGAATSSPENRCDDIESAQSTPFGSPCKTSNAYTSTNTTTITTALTTARLLALGAENALRKASGNGHNSGHHQSSLFAAVSGSGGSNLLNRGEPLRDSVKYKQMYRARRANGDVILQDHIDPNTVATSPTSVSPAHHRLSHHPGGNNDNTNFSSSPPSSSSVNSTWSASSQDQLMSHQTQPTHHQPLPKPPSNSRQQQLPPTIKSSTSNHSAITGLSTVQSMPLPPIPVQISNSSSTRSKNLMPHFSNPPTSSSGGMSFYANSGADAPTAANVEVLPLPFSLRAEHHHQQPSAAVAAASTAAHTPTSVQQIAPTKQKKSNKNSAAKRAKDRQSSAAATSTGAAMNDRALLRQANSSTAALQQASHVNETVSNGPGKNNRRKKKSSGSRRASTSGSNVSNLEKNIQKAIGQERRRASLESTGSDANKNAAETVLEMREPRIRGVSAKMM